jgi:hypothetical protein
MNLTLRDFEIDAFQDLFGFNAYMKVFDFERGWQSFSFLVVLCGYSLVPVLNMTYVMSNENQNGKGADFL